jgi:hypothetical protein
MDKPAGPRTLILDVETSPIEGYVWSLWKQNVGLNQIKTPSRVICFAAKWLGERSTLFFSEHEYRHEEMIDAAYSLLDQADVVMSFNGTQFDIPRLNGEFALKHMAPYSPIKQIDLLVTARKLFGFPSNKLEYLATVFGLGGKVNHNGMPLWLDCLAGDEKAWRLMRKYNKRDVTLLEELYAEYFQPWVVSHPSHAAFTGLTCCPACGSLDLMKRGFCYTSVSQYQQFQCQKCGKYSRATHRERGVEITGVVL